MSHAALQVGRAELSMVSPELRQIESVLSEPTFHDSPFFLVPFGQLCSFVFHLLFLILFTQKLTQPIRIALEKQG